MSAKPGDILVEGRGITLTYGERTVLDQVAVSVRQNEIVTVIGPNGAGKTTLIKVLMGLAKPQSGVVERKKGLVIGYVPQKISVDSTMPLTVEYFLRLGLSRGMLGQGRLDKALKETEVSHLRYQPVQNVSGGEMQRVLLARALLRDPQLLVLDEPAQGVDVTGQSELYGLIGHIRESRGCGVLMVSHDLHLVMSATDTVLCLNGHVCCAGHPETVSADPAYVSLFGPKVAQTLALYHHHHDHTHDLHGEVVDGEKDGCGHG